MILDSSHASHVRWLTDRVAQLLDTQPADIDVDRPLTELGISSLQAVELAGDLETRLGRPVKPTIVYDHPSITELAHFAAST
ncbi:MAG: acyl carrier protein [Microlunatus sp.]